MKKVTVLIISFVMALSLMGCPEITTLPLELESTPISEMLFDLPEEASFISQTFHFSLFKPEYSNVSNMQIKGTYVIQNDGNDASMNMLYTSQGKLTFYDTTYVDLSLHVKINHMEEKMNWTFSNDMEQQLNESEITYDVYEKYVVGDLVDPYSITVHKYKFDCPKAGYNEEMTLHIPKDTYMLYSSYMKKIDESGYMNIQDVDFEYQGEETNIPAFSNETYLTLYTIENPIQFESNYDFEGSHEVTNLADLVQSVNGLSYQAKYLIYVMNENMDKGIYSAQIDYFIQETRYMHFELLDMYTLSVYLPGNGAQTIVEVTFPSIQYGTYIEDNTRYLTYDFYLDTKRYVDENIPVTLFLETDYDIVSNSVGLTDSKTVYNLNSIPILYFVFSTEYEELE